MFQGTVSVLMQEDDDLILTNFERGTHAMTLIGGGFVATTGEALLCAFAMHPFEDQPGVRRRLVRQIWRRARQHAQASRYASGDALVALAADALRDYRNLAAEAGETAFEERCIHVLSAAQCDSNGSTTKNIIPRGLDREATRFRFPNTMSSFLLPSA